MFRRDPCGMVCVLLVYAAVGYADYGLTVWMLVPTLGDSIWGAINVAVFNTLVFLALLSHARTMLTDPGLVPVTRDASSKALRMGRRPRADSSSSDEDIFTDRHSMMRHADGTYVGSDWTVCTRCESMRPPRAHHCRVCRRCVRRMDHHCPWVNNCVGEYNQKYFLQFLMYVALCSAHSFIIIVLSWVYHDEHGATGMKGPYGQNAHHAKVLHTIFLSMESALFGMFVLAVSCDQLQAIFNEETAVEAVVRRSRRTYRRARRYSRTALLAQVCGNGSIWSWLLPCSTLPSQRDVVAYPNCRDAIEESRFDV